MLLDRSLLENGQFMPQIGDHYLLKLVSETTEILQG